MKTNDSKLAIAYRPVAELKENPRNPRFTASCKFARSPTVLRRLNSPANLGGLNGHNSRRSWAA